MTIRAKNKLDSCLRLAREASRDSWQLYKSGSALRHAMRILKREAIEDARYWRAKMTQDDPK